MKNCKTLLFLFLFFNTVPSAFSDTPPNSRQSATVDAVLTGDSIRLKGGKVLRYIGLESYSPESKNRLERTYGVRAQEFNQSLVGGKEIQVEWGARLRDKQNRLLGYVYTQNGVFVNEELLREGHAKVKIVAPNTAHAERFRDLEYGARRARKGLWENEPKDASKIRRYVGEKNTKIYYFPHSKELERIPEAQLVYFNSRVDAKAAGYRACFTCKEDRAEATDE